MIMWDYNGNNSLDTSVSYKKDKPSLKWTS